MPICLFRSLLSICVMLLVSPSPQPSPQAHTSESNKMGLSGSAWGDVPHATWGPLTHSTWGYMGLPRVHWVYPMHSCPASSIAPHATWPATSFRTCYRPHVEPVLTSFPPPMHPMSLEISHPPPLGSHLKHHQCLLMHHLLVSISPLVCYPFPTTYTASADEVFTPSSTNGTLCNSRKYLTGH